jgi:hypothetical protein
VYLWVGHCYPISENNREINKNQYERDVEKGVDMPNLSGINE